MTAAKTETLTEFLLARTAEDEAGQVERYNIFDGHRQPFRTRVEHTAPSARVLAECQAKRRIVELHAVRVERDWVNPVDGPAYQTNEHYCEVCGWVPEVCDTVKALALPYADHPDYREEWRP